MLVSAPSGTTIMSAPMRVKPTAMLRSMLRIRVAPVKTTPLATATAAISRKLRALRRPRFCSARLASSQRRPRRSAVIATKYDHVVQDQSVHERVCFICSSLVGMITQSWWPPLLGRMPINVSVEVSMTAMPLDWRWNPLNGVSTYLPS